MEQETYEHYFGKNSKANLRGVLPSLILVAERAIRICKYDGTIIGGGGLRTEEQALVNVANGTGIINSRHRKQADGYGHAIDLLPLVDGVVQWKLIVPFKAMANAVKYAAAELLVPIRQGCDWNMNGEFGEKNEYDWAHFESPKPGYFALATAEMHNHRAELGLDVADVSNEQVIVSREVPLSCPHFHERIQVVAG